MMTTTPTDRETVERIIAREPMLTSMPPQETEVAKTLRALLDERDAAVARAESAMMDGYDLAKEEYRDRIAELEVGVERLREADQIVWDLMADEHWRTPKSDIHPRMVSYLRKRRAALGQGGE